MSQSSTNRSLALSPHPNTPSAWTLAYALPFDFTEHEVVRFFSDLGRLEINQIMYGRPLSDPFVRNVYIKYASTEDAQRGVNKFDDSLRGGRRIRIDFAPEMELAEQFITEEDDPTDVADTITIFHWPSWITINEIRDLLRRAGYPRSIGFRVELKPGGYTDKVTTVRYESEAAAQRAMFLFHGFQLFENRDQLQAIVHIPTSRPTLSECDAEAVPSNPDATSDAEATGTILIRGLPSSMNEIELRDAMDFDGHAVRAWVYKLHGQDGPAIFGSVQYRSRETARKVLDEFDGAELCPGWKIGVCFDQLFTFGV